MHMARDAGQHPQLLGAVMQINADRRRWVVDELRARLGDLSGKSIGILGLAFKPNTDDVRDAPALDLIRLLQREGARVAAYDPAAADNAARETKGVSFCEDAYSVGDDADAIVLVTEWNEFRHLDPAALKARMRGNVFIDGRNVYDPAEMRAAGFDYLGMGRGTTELAASPVAEGRPLAR
jgi:UDPglucose 6-dehydrogenase